VTARALGDALGIPVSGVCTLDVLAADVVAADVLAVGESFLVATDARRREVYWAGYDATGRRTGGPSVARAADIGWGGRAFGAGALLYPEAFGRVAEPRHPRAAVLADLVVRGAVEVLPPDPLYLRRPDAVPPGPRKVVTPA
jgi:tRNA A37 threonylcarbamoyladenosine modification protein TsaB